MNSAMTSMQKAPANAHRVAWWRVPHMWLVVGGPLVVVMASLVTFVIAASHPDPVLNKQDYERDLAAEQEKGKARQDALVSMQPADKARNHAASPLVQDPAK